MYTALNGAIGLVKIVSRGRLVPHDYDQKEYWSIRTGGSKPWLFRAITNSGKFWAHTDDTALTEIIDDSSSGSRSQSRSHSRTGSEKTGARVATTPPPGIEMPERAARSNRDR